MAGLSRNPASSTDTLALLKREAERRAWVAASFQADIQPAGEFDDLDGIRARFAVLAMAMSGPTASGLPGRAFFGTVVQSILNEEPEASAFAIGFVRIRNGGHLDAAALRPMAQILRETLRPEDLLAEVRPAVFGVVSPATTGAALEDLLGEAALSIASATFFDVDAGESRAYEAEVAMGRLDGRRTVEDVFRDTRRAAVFGPAARLGAAPGARISG